MDYEKVIVLATAAAEAKHAMHAFLALGDARREEGRKEEADRAYKCADGYLAKQHQLAAEIRAEYNKP